jgi:ABC-type multidrug transport system ATPase subunit
MLLDEPSSSLDAVSKRVLWKTLAEVSVGRSMLLTVSAETNLTPKSTIITNTTNLFPAQTHSMEEAAALATRAAIMSRRILTVGPTSFLRQKYGNAYHVHMILKSAPASPPQEMAGVEAWVRRSFPGARLDPFGSHQGQIRFEVPAATVVRSRYGRVENSGDWAPEEDVIAPAGTAGTPKAVKREGWTSIVAELFQVLEKSKNDIGLQYYSVGATTLNDVFLNVVRENNVLEDGATETKDKGWRLLCCV